MNSQFDQLLSDVPLSPVCNNLSTPKPQHSLFKTVQCSACTKDINPKYWNKHTKRSNCKSATQMKQQSSTDKDQIISSPDMLSVIPPVTNLLTQTMKQHYCKDNIEQSEESQLFGLRSSYMNRRRMFGKKYTSTPQSIYQKSWLSHEQTLAALEMIPMNTSDFQLDQQQPPQNYKILTQPQYTISLKDISNMENKLIAFLTKMEKASKLYQYNLNRVSLFKKIIAEHNYVNILQTNYNLMTTSPILFQNICSYQPYFRTFAGKLDRWPINRHNNELKADQNVRMRIPAFENLSKRPYFRYNVPKELLEPCLTKIKYTKDRVKVIVFNDDMNVKMLLYKHDLYDLYDQIENILDEQYLQLGTLRSKQAISRSNKVLQETKIHIQAIARDIKHNQDYKKLILAKSQSIRTQLQHWSKLKADIQSWVLSISRRLVYDKKITFNITAQHILEYLHKLAIDSQGKMGLLKRSTFCFDNDSYISIAAPSQPLSFFVILYRTISNHKNDEYKLNVHYGVQCTSIIKQKYVIKRNRCQCCLYMREYINTHEFKHAAEMKQQPIEQQSSISSTVTLEEEKEQYTSGSQSMDIQSYQQDGLSPARTDADFYAISSQYHSEALYHGVAPRRSQQILFDEQTNEQGLSTCDVSLTKFEEHLNDELEHKQKQYMVIEDNTFNEQQKRKNASKLLTTINKQTISNFTESENLNTISTMATERSSNTPVTQDETALSQVPSKFDWFTGIHIMELPELLYLPKNEKFQLRQSVSQYQRSKIVHKETMKHLKGIKGVTIKSKNETKKKLFCYYDKLKTIYKLAYNTYYKPIICRELQSFIDRLLSDYNQKTLAFLLLQNRSKLDIKLSHLFDNLEIENDIQLHWHLNSKWTFECIDSIAIGYTHQYRFFNYYIDFIEFTMLFRYIAKVLQVHDSKGIIVNSQRNYIIERLKYWEDDIDNISINFSESKSRALVNLALDFKYHLSGLIKDNIKIHFGEYRQVVEKHSQVLKTNKHQTFQLHDRLAGEYSSIPDNIYYNPEQYDKQLGYLVLDSRNDKEEQWLKLIPQKKREIKKRKITYLDRFEDFDKLFPTGLGSPELQIKIHKQLMERSDKSDIMLLYENLTVKSVQVSTPLSIDQAESDQVQWTYTAYLKDQVVHEQYQLALTSINIMDNLLLKND